MIFLKRKILDFIFINYITFSYIGACVMIFFIYEITWLINKYSWYDIRSSLLISTFLFLIILFLPGIVGLFILLCGSCYSVKKSYSLAVCSLWSSFLCCFTLLNPWCDCSSNYYLLLGNWFTVGPLSINWEFSLDFVSSIITLVITSISAIVHHYSYYYLNGDPYMKRFVGLLLLFTFFMLVLVLAENFIILFIGWEGVGICSYLLINFWFTRMEANRAGLKALIFNRIGDFFFLLGIGSCYYFFYSLNFSSLSYIITLSQTNETIFFNLTKIDVVCLCFFIAALAKSAQLIFYPWLADAMEGPTPVSALLHSATMVTAGVYLILRCNFLFFYSDFITSSLLVSGILTSLITAVIACAQWDLKKIIAYSTCSQLGLMFVALGTKSYSFALFHLVTHAYSKALLFLCAGVIIHFFSGEQDIRKMGSAHSFLPLVYICMLAANFSLIGLPYTSGFYSKELILSSLILNESAYYFSLICYLYIGCLTTLTAFYSLRLMYFVFWTKFNGYYHILQKANFKIPKYVLNLLLFLFLISFTIGFMLRRFIFYSEIFSLNCFKLTQDTINFTEVTSYIFLGFLVCFFICILVLCCWIIFIKTISVDLYTFKFYFIKTLFIWANQGFFLDAICNLIALNILRFGYYLNTELEKGFLEYFGPYGLTLFFNKTYRYFTAQNSIYIMEMTYMLGINILLCFFFNIFIICL